VAAASVSNSEEKPLSVAVSIYVVLKDEIVLGVRNLNSAQQVARLKSGLKYKRRVVFKRGDVVLGWRDIGG
jgi:hypothetical protein